MAGAPLPSDGYLPPGGSRVALVGRLAEDRPSDMQVTLHDEWHDEVVGVVQVQCLPATPRPLGIAKLHARAPEVAVRLVRRPTNDVERTFFLKRALRLRANRWPVFIHRDHADLPQ